MSDLDERIRRAYPPSDTDASHSRGWDGIDRFKTEEKAGRYGRRWRLRTVLVAGLLFATVSAVAIAQPSVVQQMFGDDPSAPANRLDAFDQPKEASTSDDGSEGDVPAPPRSPWMDVFIEPSEHPDQEMDSLRQLMANTTSLPSPDPAGNGELFPMEQLRLLVEYKEDGIVGRVMAIPTTNGKVCYWRWIVDDTFTGACVARLDLEQPITSGILILEDDRSIISGLAVNEVAQVNVRVNSGRVEAATLGQNAYFWRSANSGERVVGLQVKLIDGRILELDALGRLK